MIYSNFPEVKYLYQENQGVSSARNKGIDHAQSEWIALLDSDDQWLPEKLTLQLHKLSIDPLLKICHSDEIWIRNGVRVNAMKKHSKRGGDIYKYCLPLCAMSPSSIVIHRSVFEQVGTFDESLPACEDYDLWLRMTAQFPVLYIDQPLIRKYGGHADQLSQKYWGMDRFRIKALEKMLTSNVLTPENRKLTLDMLIKKASIYRKGALKRGKLDEADYYQSLIRKYSCSNKL